MTPVKAKLEATANSTVIVLALAVGYVVLGWYATAYRTPRSIVAGDRMANIPGVDWGQHRRTLVLALNTGCHYCEESLPFYQKLALEQRPGGHDLEVVAVFPNESGVVRQFMAHVGPSIRSVAEVPLETLHAVLTPTLILVNREGRVERSWIGVLTAREELDVLKVASASPGCLSDMLADLQTGEREGSGSQVQSKTRSGGGG